MFDRSAGGLSRSVRAQTHVFSGPVRGLIRNEALVGSQPGGAEVLENFFPTPQSCRMRRGTIKHATVDAAVDTLMIYDTGSTQELFAATVNDIFDVTSPADPDVAETASVTGLTNGDWGHEQFATSAGSFLVAVNGADSEQLYDGSEWWTIDADTIEGLAYDAETGTFTAGLTVTGGGSGATATIFRVEDDGTTGTLWIKGRSGTFNDDETITDSSTGSATSNIPSGVTTKYTGITGVATAALSHVWQFKKRLFYIEDGTLSAWYLGTLAIGGAATEFPLTGLFSRGGALQFGGTWSHDSGYGLDDFCIFLTTEGEVAVYQGTNPATWSLVGVYQLGKPLHKNAVFRAGGDLGIVTDDGIVNMSAVIQKDRAGLTLTALTYPIEDLWREIINDRKGTGDFSVTLWHDQAALYVGIPRPSDQEDLTLVANAHTGAWTVYTGWSVKDWAVLNDELYFGTAQSTVLKAEQGGDDLDAPYSAVWVPRFEMLGTPQEKAALHARFVGRSVNTTTPQLFASADYIVKRPTPLSADANPVTSTYGTGVYGTAIYGETAITKKLLRWSAVAAVGQALAPGLQITSGRTVPPEVEIAALHLQYEVGQVMG